MPSWNSRSERECRQRLEAQKGRLYRSSLTVAHPCLRIKDENLEIARGNIKRHDWAKRFYENMVALADHYADRTVAWIETMVPEPTPLHIYGTFCPVCEGDNTWSMIWDHRDPEKLTCCHCGVVMTDQKFPEEGRLELPRSGQTLTYYLRRGEKGDPQFSTGRNAFVWAGRKVHTSFLGAIRQKKTHHMPGVARALAILHRMTGQDRYARTAAVILKRFAQVYPHYLFHDYWNTFMDCDPLYACELMARDEDVGKYEVNACPDQNARSGMKSGKLIQTFWGCGRMTAGGVHHEAHLLISLAEALDLLWEAKDGNGCPFLSKEEQERVVRDLLVEGLFTFTHWEGINNKVAGCRVGEVALGRFLGAPAYVHRGVEGFEPYLRGFFNFDGSTNEGSGYYAYAVSNVHLLPEVARGYTDPPSYRKKDRFENLNLYDPDGVYRTVLRARPLMTLPDGRVPHTADAHEGHPGWPGPAWLHNIGAVRLGREFVPFVNFSSGDDFAFFNRPAVMKGTDPPPVRDIFFPGWLLTVFNTGYERMFQEDLTGAATFLMNFYEPDGHDHPDALNIAMFVEGVEVLSDLGYIGDHPLNASIRSTLKHNLVVLDEKEHLPRGQRPPGNVRLIAASPHTKVIEADCRAYAEAEVYRRCCFMVHRGSGPAYLVDLFRAKGGKVHDYAIHGEGKLTALPAFTDGRPIPLSKRRGIMGRDIEKLRAGKTCGQPWTVAWADEGVTMRVHFASPTGEVIVGEGPGQRDHSEIGARHDYLFARNRDRGLGNGFVTVIDHYRETPDITGVQAIALPDGADGPMVLRVFRRAGEDTILHSPDLSERVFGRMTFAGRAAVHSREQDGRLSLFLTEATRFTALNLSVTLRRPAIEGTVTTSDRSGFETDARIPDAAALAGSFVEVEDPDQKCWTAYAIKSIRGRRVEVDHFPFNAGTRFRIPSVFSLEQEAGDAFRLRATTAAEIRLRTDRFSKAVYERDEKETCAAEARVEDGCLTIQIDPKALKAGEGLIRLKS